MARGIGKEIDQFVKTFLATSEMMNRRKRYENAEGMDAASMEQYIRQFTGGKGGKRGGAATGGASTGGGVARGGDVAPTAVYDAYRKAGLSEAQARAMTAEVGRENGFQSKYIFGTHSDPANKATNVGLMSWQGDRRPALLAHLQSKGRIDKDGRIIPGQETIDAQAEFSVGELRSGKYNVKGFLDNENVDPETAARVLGRNYIKWRYDDPKYASHHATRKSWYNRLDKDLQGQQQNTASGDDWSDAPKPTSALPVEADAPVQQATVPMEEDAPVQQAAIPMDEAPAPEQPMQMAALEDAPASGDNWDMNFDDTAFAEEGGMIEAPSEAVPTQSGDDGMRGEALDAALKHMQTQYGLNDRAGALPGTDPDRAKRVQAFGNNEDAMSDEAVQALMQRVDPEGKDPDRNGTALTQLYQFYAGKGDRELAGRVASGVVQTARRKSMAFGQQAMEALRKRDLSGAGQALIAAYNEVPDGRTVKGEVGPDGNGMAMVIDTKTGKTVQKMPITPQVMIEAAQKFATGSEFYNHIMQFARPRVTTQYADGGLVEDAPTGGDEEDPEPALADDELPGAGGLGDDESALPVPDAAGDAPLPAAALPTEGEGSDTLDTPAAASGADEPEEPAFIPYHPKMNAAQRRMVDQLNSRRMGVYRQELSDFRQQRSLAAREQRQRTSIANQNERQRLSTERIERARLEKAKEMQDREARRQEAIAAQRTQQQQLRLTEQQRAEHNRRMKDDPKYAQDQELRPVEQKGQALERNASDASLYGEDFYSRDKREFETVQGKKLAISAKNSEEEGTVADRDGEGGIYATIDSVWKQGRPVGTAGRQKVDKDDLPVTINPKTGLPEVDPEEKRIAADLVEAIQRRNKISTPTAVRIVADGILNPNASLRVAKDPVSEGYRVVINGRPVVLDNNEFREFVTARELHARSIADKTEKGEAAKKALGVAGQQDKNAYDEAAKRNRERGRETPAALRMGEPVFKPMTREERLRRQAQ